MQSLLPHTFQYNPTFQHFNSYFKNYYTFPLWLKRDRRHLEIIRLNRTKWIDTVIEGECSIPEVLSREQIIEFNDGDVLNHQNNSGLDSVNQRFSDMNRQLNELTNLVLALTEKISSSNREGNELNTVSINHEARSDNMSWQF